MSRYTKAIAGFFVPIIASGLIKIAGEYGLPIDGFAANAAATLVVGIATGCVVWLVRNAPPDLVQAIEEATGIDIDGE